MNNLDGNGVYLYLKNDGREITIRQDFAGSYGIFIYNQDGRFVLSNSYLLLAEYLRTRVRLTLNRDYASHLMTISLASMSYSETLINEIRLLPRDCIIHIDTASKSLSIEDINYHENSVPLNSAEGMKILDDWFNRWTRLYRNIARHSGNLTIDLTGGMDSRIGFVLMLKSGVDLDKICINSGKGKGYSLPEDYAIASEIADHFGFTLNNHENYTGGILNYSLDDSISSVYYSRIAVHKQLHFHTQKYEHKRFRSTGYFGESVRSHKGWDPSDKKFILSRTLGAGKFSVNVKNQLASSMERVLQSMLDEICRRKGVSLNSELESKLYRDTRARHHFANSCIPDFMRNAYVICPLIDRGIQKLKLNVPECEDRNLLHAVIYARYCPELLKFRFARNEKIDESTITFAEKLSAEFPVTCPENHDTDDDFSLVSCDEEVTRLLDVNNPPLDAGGAEKLGTPGEYLKGIFDKTAFRKLFAAYFDEEIYLYAEEYFKRTIWHPFAECQAVTAVTKAIKDVMISEGICGNGIMNDLNIFSQSNYASETDKVTDRFLYVKKKAKGTLRKAINLLKRIIKLPYRAARRIFRILTKKQ